MRKNKIVFLFLIFILLFSFISFSIATEDFTLEAEELIWDSSEKLHQMNALSVPERDINLKIENLNVGCRVYLYLPVDLLRFNAQKFVGNNVKEESLGRFICKKKKGKDEIVFTLEIVKQNYDSIVLKSNLNKGETKDYKELISKIKENLS